MTNPFIIAMRDNPDRFLNELDIAELRTVAEGCVAVLVRRARRAIQRLPERFRRSTAPSPTSRYDFPSTRQVVQVFIKIQRPWVGQSLDVFRLSSMDDIADGDFGDLARLGSGNVVDGDNPGGHVPWRAIEANLGFDEVRQLFVQLQAFAQAHEKHHADVAFPILADGDAFNNLVQFFNLPINFRRADAHAARIERRVRAAMDNHAAARGPGHMVAVTPDIVEPFEIGAPIPGAIRVVPESERHGGEGLGADQFAFFAGGRRAVVRIDVHRHAERRALNLAPPHGLGRVSQDETADDVRSTGDRGQKNIFLHVPVNIIETFRREGEPVEAMVSNLSREWVSMGSSFSLRSASIYLADVEEGHAFRVGVVEEDLAVGMKGEPSKSRIVAPHARAETIQFHIIQPQVVK